MTHDLTLLLWSAVLGLVQLAAAALAKGRQEPPGWLSGARDEPPPAMALYRREGWVPIGHGPDAPNARPGLVLIDP